MINDSDDHPKRLHPRQGTAATLFGGVAAAMLSSLSTFIAINVLHGLWPKISKEEFALNPSVIATGAIVTSLAMTTTALMTPIVCDVPVRNALGLNRIDPRLIPLALIGALGIAPLGDWTRHWLKEIAPELSVGNLDFLEQALSNFPLPLGLFCISLLPGIAEELFFRGMLQRSLPVGTIGISITGCFFALFHIDPPHIAGVLPLGLYLSWLLHRTDSVWIPMLCHITNNALALLMLSNSNIEATSTPVPLPYLSFGLITSLLCSLWIVKMTAVRFGTTRQGTKAS
ncbi:MAG: CPBP family intramembrane glutamic endopeptidase [Myxococcota bacterium]